MKLDLAQLEALLAIVDEGSFEGAADVLSVTPSAISQRVKALEQQAGLVLLRRVKPVMPTEAALPYVQAARQIQAVVQHTLEPCFAAHAQLPVIPLAANADSLDSWLVPALASVADIASFRLHRDDQDHTAELLRSGKVMAGIVSHEVPVQGCESVRLGAMRYLPLASADFVAQWLPHGATPEALAKAPVIQYDRKDRLQDEYLGSLGYSHLSPPRHYFPSNMAFIEAISQDMGWGMVPEQLANDAIKAGKGVCLGGHVDVTLFWHQWKIASPQLDALRQAVKAAANYSLRTPEV